MLAPAAVLLAGLAAAAGAAQAQSSSAVCVFSGVPASNEPALQGVVYLSSNPATFDLNVTIQVSGIQNNPNSEHGIHIHTWGDLGSIEPSNDGASVGPHWNPTNVQHNCPPNATRHWGDTGNWQATAGSISGTKILTGFTQDPLSGSMSALGRSIVIHNLTDQCNGTAGFAGAKIAFCTIGIDGSASNTASQTATGLSATAALFPTSNNPGGIGRVTFVPGSPGYNVKMSSTGLVPLSVHGFHVHWYGDLSVATGTAAGGHFNPANVNHSLPDNTPRHVGDMGNAYHWAANTLYYSYNNNYFTVGGGAANDIVGRAVIIHENPDVCVQPTGAAGARMNVGVIGITDSTTEEVIDVATPTTQDNSACIPPTTGTTGALVGGCNYAPTSPCQANTPLASGGYACCDGISGYPYEWDSSTVGAVTITQNTDDNRYVVNLPFTFPWYGESVTLIVVSTNGWISFAGTQGSDRRGRNMPSGNSFSNPRGVFAWWWDDTYANSMTRKDITHPSYGAGMLITFLGRDLGGSLPLDVQIRIFENGLVDAHYRDWDPSPRHYVGWESNDAMEGFTYRSNAAVPPGQTTPNSFAVYPEGALVTTGSTTGTTGLSTGSTGTTGTTGVPPPTCPLINGQPLASGANDAGFCSNFDSQSCCNWPNGTSPVMPTSECPRQTAFPPACASAIQDMFCVLCDPNQISWTSGFGRATVCDSYADRLYEFCRDALVSPSCETVESTYGFAAAWLNEVEDMINNANAPGAINNVRLSASSSVPCYQYETATGLTLTVNAAPASVAPLALTALALFAAALATLL